MKKLGNVDKKEPLKSVKWGIIGCGDVCERKSGPAFYKIEHSSLIAVMRRNEVLVKDFALRHNVPAYYTNADDLINDPDINAVYVATPPSSHKKYTIQALEAGKPVYVEKPMAMNYAECVKMNEAANHSGQKLFTAYYRRALPYFLKVKELLENNAIGNILTVKIEYFRPPLVTDFTADKHTWRVDKNIAGGGYFFDMAPHTLDILDFLLGEITDAQGTTANLSNLYDVEDTISATFRFNTGVLGTGLWCYASSPAVERDIIEITGSTGSLLFNTFAFEPIQLTTSSGTQLHQTSQPEHIQQPLIQTIVNELRGIGTCPSTGITATRTSWVMDKIFNTMY